MKKKQKRKVGRPSDYNKVNLDQVSSMAALGLIDTEIALLLNISPRTLAYWKEKPEFLQALKRGKLQADAKVVSSLYERATQKGDTIAMIFWLKNRQPENWREKVEHSGDKNNPIKFVIENA